MSSVDYRKSSVTPAREPVTPEGPNGVISIVTAMWNSAETLHDALDSIVKQTRANTEHVAIDGVSVDETLAVLRRVRVPHQRLLSEPDNGIYDALNKGIRLATGDVVGFLHADDVLAADDILAEVQRRFEDPEVDAVYGDLQYVSHDLTKVIRHWRAGKYSLARLRRGWMPPHPTLYVRKSVYEEFGGFDLSYRIAADYDWMLRVLPNLRGRIDYIPRVMVKMRVGGISNRSLRTIVQKSKEDYRALRANNIGGLGTLAWKNFSKLGQFFVRPGKGPSE